MTDRLDYSGYNFETALAQLEGKLELLDGWKDRVKSATGQIFVRLLSYVIDMDGFKIDRRAEEGYRDYARLRSSVVAIAANLGYTPRRKVGSVCTLRFSSGSPPVSIPAGTVCQTAGGVKFVTTEQGTITGAYVDLAAKQGEPKTTTVVSDGSKSQSYDVPSANEDVEAIENTSLTVDVDGSTWAKVDSFIGQAADAEVYIVVRKKTTLRVIFGDDKNGKIPPNGVDVDVNWLETLGSAGDVPSVGAVDTIEPPIATVTVENIDSAQGGEDEEDIEEIRDNMSQIYATGDRAVTAPDYRAILLAYPGVAKANAYGEQDVLSPAPPNPDFAWRVELVVVPSGGGTLTRTQENQIREFLETKKVLTTWITFKDPTYVPVDFNVTVVHTEEYTSIDIKAAVEAALDAAINFTDVDLGEALRYGDVVEAVESVDGVRYSTVEMMATYDGGLGTGGAGPYTGTLPLVPVDRGNVLVYLEEVSTGAQRRVGYDDGSGTFTSDALVASPKVSTGSQNYVTGAYSVTFDAAVSSAYRVVLKYQTGIEKSKIFGVGDGAATTFTGVLERNLSPGFVRIYEEGLYVAYDDGAGNIVDEGGGRVSGGSVNYVTGDVQVQFNAPPPADENEISSVFHYEFPDLEVGIDQMLLMGNKYVTAEVSA